MKFGIVLGVLSIIVGLALMSAGRQMCRVTCWLDDLFKLFLPKAYESLAGGISWIFFGFGLVAYSVIFLKKKKK